MEFKNKDITVYIASPYSNGWTATNVKRQMDCANELLNNGFYPYTPLLSHFQELYYHQPESKWLELDLIFLKNVMSY